MGESCTKGHLEKVKKLALRRILKFLPNDAALYLLIVKDEIEFELGRVEVHFVMSSCGCNLSRVKKDGSRKERKKCKC